MNEREKLIGLLMSAPTDIEGNRGVGVIADYLLEHGVIVPLVNVGDTVYVITTCRDFPTMLDGSYETATGYYCPCELRDICPHNADDCTSVADTEAVFEDEINSIYITDRGTELVGEYIPNIELSDYGKTVFLTREEAEEALKERETVGNSDTLKGGVNNG